MVKFSGWQYTYAYQDNMGQFESVYVISKLQTSYKVATHSRSSKCFEFKAIGEGGKPYF